MSTNISSGVNRREAEAQIINRASRDETYRQHLLSNPRAAISDEMGINLPQHFNVKVMEETGDNFYLVLPATTSAAEEGELSDLELEAVAGGKARTGGTCGGPYSGGTSSFDPENLPE